MTNEEFIARLRDCSLPPAQFDHLGHIRLGWICLQRHGLAEAVGQACGMIATYAASLGAAGKFHRTITEALMRLLHAAGASDQGMGWPAFVAANGELVADARAALALYYSAALLGSEQARAGFVAPDLAPLPA